jgi:hypothetical protein
VIPARANGLGDAMLVSNSRNNRMPAPLERRTTRELRAIADGLRQRATAGLLPRPMLLKEIAKIEGLIASRQRAVRRPAPRLGKRK